MDPWNPIMSEAAKNPKHAAGLKKQPYRHIPPSAIAAEGRVMAGGAAKYGAFNWGEAGVVAGVYYEAIKRHLEAWWTGEDADPESGESHLAHIRACAGILIDCILLGNMEDDRPIGKTAPVGHGAPAQKQKPASLKCPPNLTVREIAGLVSKRTSFDPLA